MICWLCRIFTHHEVEEARDYYNFHLLGWLERTLGLSIFCWGISLELMKLSSMAEATEASKNAGTAIYGDAMNLNTDIGLRVQ